MKLTDLLQDLGPAVAYYPRLCPIMGGVAPTILVCQLLYWDGKQEDPEGWIFKTMEEIRAETGLTRTEQETARKKLKTKGFLEEKFQGLPRRLYYRVNKKALNGAWEGYHHPASHTAGKVQHGESGPEAAKPADRSAGNPQACLRVSRIMEGVKPAGHKGQNPQALKGAETTAESTPEMTTTPGMDPVRDAPGNDVVVAPEATPGEGEGHKGGSLLQKAVPEAHGLEVPERGGVALVHALCEIGVTPCRARDLVREHPSEAIRQQIGWLPLRRPEDPAAMLVAAIREGWAPPAPVLRARRRQQAGEAVKRRAGLEERRRAARAADEAALRERQDAYWATLSPEERQCLEEEIHARIREENTFLATRLASHPGSPLVVRLLEVRRRQWIARRMEVASPCG